MNAAGHQPLARLVARATRDPDVLALILFGSQARGDASARSDLDVCLVLGPDGGSRLDRGEKRIEYLADGNADVSIFQDLPLAIRSRVLREGKILLVRDEQTLYELAIRTVRAFEDFRHIHREYLDHIARD